MQSAVKSMIEATIDTAATPARRPGARRRSVKPPAAAPSRWRVAFAAIYAKMRTRRSWVAAMFILGTVDVIMNLVNFVQVSSPELNYGLVIGPPTRDLWISMCVFTVLGTLLYIPETINTFSALYSSEGETILPLHFELPITLLLEHIPLAATDYFVARCRREYTTDVASFCGVVRLVFIFVRLVWYAHIEGKKIKKNDKYEIRQLLIMVCCLLFSVAIAFPIMNWRYEVTGVLKNHHLVNVSIYMLKRDPPPEGHKFNIELTDILLRQGWSETNTSLVASAWLIATAHFNGGRTVPAYYNCHHNALEKPRECTRSGARFLQFKFQYLPVQTVSPYGEISYNYAEICLDRNSTVNSADDENEDDNDDYDNDDDQNNPYMPACRQAKRPLAGGWRLFYFLTHRWHSQRKVRFNVSEPFWKVYTSPMPKYNPDIMICQNITRRLCTKTSTNYDLKSIKEDDCPEELDLRQRFSI